jgi:dTDP-4-amino-4,6-dideoxygalactose transaminase
MPRPLHVTEPFLPDFGAFSQLVEGVWERRQLTNQGPLVIELEERLRAALDLPHPVHCVANGGLGLQILLKAMGIRGRVITTPFSYIATTSCALWEGLEVTFADIAARTLNIDPAAVEAAITPDCEAIIATHAFGNPCDVDALQAIASKHGLALIYDAAHAYGVRHNGHSILRYGDASMVSTHATKLFHTVEGGFVTARDPNVAEKVEWMRRFGHQGPEAFQGVGINAKMSELHAAMGLAILPRIERILSRRQATCELYDELLKDAQSPQPAFRPGPDTEWNYSYYPVLFPDERTLLHQMSELQAAGIFPRRYFYPMLDRALPGRTPSAALPVASDISSRILCLPLSAHIDPEDARLICRILRENNTRL